MGGAEAVQLSGRNESWLKRHTCAWCDQTLWRALRNGCAAMYEPRCDPSKKDFSGTARLPQTSWVTMNPVLMHVDRAQRRSLLKAEECNRAAGTWGAWEKITFPKGSIGRGWSHDFDTAHRNKVFSVLDRILENGVRHLAVSSLSGIRPGWREMQRIKDELAGCDKTAVEVYPPSLEIVDQADMFHIWVLPEPLPFGLHAPAFSSGEV